MIVFLGFLALISAGCLAVLFLVRKKFILVTIRGNSMFPTFAVGERLFIIKCPTSHRYKVGQIVIVHPPYLPGEWRKKLYIKRLVGLPGDKVVVSPENLNSQIHVAEASHIDATGNHIWHLPDSYCFIQGDSYWSEDCRAWGPVPLNSLVGIVLFKLPQRSNPPAPVVPDENILPPTNLVFSLTEKGTE